MLDLRRLIMPKPRRDRRLKSAFRVRADLLGRVGEVVFVPRGRAKHIHSNGTSVLVDITRDDKADFTYPELRGFNKVPEASALPLKGGAQYIFSGSVDVLGGAKVSAVLMYFDAERKLGHASTPLTTGSFAVVANLPATAQQAALGFRVKGPACFAIRSLSLTEVPQVDLAEEPRTVMMIVLNDIVHDGRVLKTAQTLMNHGYAVTLLGMWRTQNSTLTATHIAGTRALIFPNPSTFLRNAPVRALNWEHMVAYLRATMWHYVQQGKPRFIHTHDYHTVPLGFEFTRRLRELGHEVHWLHDFHEYVAGIDHMAPDWQRVALEHEALGTAYMDQRFTVSPMISKWLQKRYQLREAPTVVLNAPPMSAVQADIGRTIRSDLGLAPAVDLIVFTGGVSEARNLHIVVSALAECPGCHLALITNNTGDYVERLRQIAADGGYPDRLHFLPYVHPHEITGYVSDASLGLIPYRRSGNSNAAMPNKLFDYLHAGLPIVASNLDLIQDFLRQWQIGEVFDEDDVQDCAEAIGRVLSRQEFYRSNIRSNEELRRGATWDAQSKKILDAYRRLEQVPGALPAAAS